MTEQTDYWETAKELTSNQLKLSLMRSSRDRWRLVAMRLAEDLYKLSRDSPALEPFLNALDDPFDGDGLGY